MDFYSEFKKFCLSKPQNATASRVAENATFGDYLYRAKNIYLSYFLYDAEDCYYSEYLSKAKDCVDCAYLSGSELCYECVDCTGLYNGSFLQDCHNCSNCEFCLDCMNCKDCFGCFGLRHKQFCIFNKPYTEEEYRRKVGALRQNPPKKIWEILSEEFQKHPRLSSHLVKAGGKSLGDYIYFGNNCYLCFGVQNTSDSAYLTEVLDRETSSSNSIDCNFAVNINSCFECHDVSASTNCLFLEHCASCEDSEYLRQCYNCKNCFGCVYLINKEYCILNRQFTREEYLVALAKIKKELKEAGTYGKPLAEVLR
ncbi:MAG: hypothetical protein AAB588_05695 [Patescibacteria group bacterium]